MSDKSKIVWQRCFQIPRDGKTLDLFLVKLQFSSSQLSHFEAEWVFENGEFYDVVVNERGDAYPYNENEIEKFVEKIKEAGDSSRWKEEPPP